MTILLAFSLALADPPAGWKSLDAPDLSFRVAVPAKTVRTGTRSRTFRSGRVSFRVQLAYAVTADGLTLTAESLNLAGPEARGLKPDDLHNLVANGDTQDGWQVGLIQPAGTGATYTATKGADTRRVQMTGGKSRLFILTATGAAVGPAADTFFDSLTPTPERVGKDKPGDAKPGEAKPDDAKPAKPPAPAGDAPEWTTDPAKMVAPDTPLAGTLLGGPFAVEKAELRGGVLTVRQGAGFHPDAAALVFLFLGADSPAGKTYLVGGRGKQPGTSPHVHLKRLAPGEKLPGGDAMTGDFGLRLEFGPARAGKIPGKLYLCCPDKGKGETSIAGRFEIAWPAR